MSSGSVQLDALSRKLRVPADLIYVVGLVVGSLLSIALFNNLVKTFYRSAAPHSAIVATLPIVAAALLALAFLHVRSSQFVPLLRIALRSSSLGLLVYLLVERPDFTAANPNFAGDAEYIWYTYYFVVALAAASIVFPAFNIPVAIYIMSAGFLISPISGMGSSTLDIRYMLDMAIYLTIFPIGLQLLERRGIVREYDQHQQTITFIAFGLHLGNYFWSGVAKLLVGPFFWTWALENQTQNLIPYSIDKGTLPFGHIPWMVDYAYSLAGMFVLPLNLAIIGFQLFAIICVLRISWLRIATTFYDLMHIGIYVLGGLLFWPWIWNNFTILIATNSPRLSISRSAKAACIVTILLGNPLVEMYKSARLAWFDVADARQSYFEAVTDSGNVRVPPSFFLSHSYGVSLGYMDGVPHSGHYGHSNWNSVPHYERQLTSGTCPAPPTGKVEGEETPEHRAVRLEKLGRFIRAHHAKMIDRAETFGPNSYYLRLHHHPSNPYLFGEFSNLNLKDVRAYNLVLESACYQLHDGHMTKKVVGKSVDRFDVR